MAEAASRSERRHKRRVRRRIPCELITAERRFTGIVLDVSVDGLFVQTSAVMPAGTSVHVRVSATPQSPAMMFEARVARSKRVPPQLVAAASGGVGLRVVRPPPEFALLQGAGAEAAPEAAAPRAPAPPAAPPLPRFRVRLQQKVGNRSRAVVVEAADAGAARARALREAGVGWDVLEVEPAR